jgi:hypothetical protein
MEFEKDTPASDVDRRLAETKKLTLEPLHADIAPEAEPEAEVVARHLADGAIANISNDTEQSTAPVQPSKGLLTSNDTEQSSMRPRISLIIIAVVIIVGGIWLGLSLPALLS